MTGPRRIIIDTDPGHGYPGSDVDDGLAIALALRSPELHVEALTVVCGNVPVDQGVQAALELVEAAGAPGVPVHRGSDRPLMQDPTAWRALLDARRDDPGAQRLWGQLPERGGSRVPHPVPAAQALVDAVRARPGEITVVAIGPLTNVAMAMLLDPQWAGLVDRIVWMGGAFDVPHLLQELNAAYDPEATHVVLSSEAPLLVVPLDVTLRTALRHDAVDRLEAAGTPLARYLARTARPWVTWLAERFDRDGCPLHDPLALAVLLDPGVVQVRTASADIELRGGLTRGRTVAWDADDEELLQVVVPLPRSRPVQIAREVDNERLLALLLDRLSR